MPNILFISIPYYENSVKNFFDIFINSKIDILYLYKENHENENLNSDLCDYKIEYIDSITSIATDFEIYVLYDDVIRNLLFSDIIKYCKEHLKVINLIIKKSDHVRIQTLIQNNQYKNFFNSIIINDDIFLNSTETDSIVKNKPIIFICGLYKYNQHLKLELFLHKILNKNGISHDFLSSSMPFSNNLIFDSIINEGINDIRNIIQKIIELMNTSNAMSIISLPFDILNCSLYHSCIITSLVNMLKPNYVICCLPNEDEIINKINRISMVLLNKYNLNIDSAYISDYKKNSFEYNGEYPIITRNKKIEAQKDIVIIDSDNGIEIYNDIIKKLAFPNCVKLIK